jgi:2-polyprenyl-6-hydroxyphenyl methylase/3-demethylubiquinone-9 3-methyltransferase
MRSSAAKTDRELSIRSDEYVWDDRGDPVAHRYLMGPICGILKSAGARTVLDLGCGNGAMSAHLAVNGYEVSGCDHSESGIQLARSRAPGVEFFRHDVSDALPTTHVGKYDAVVSTEVIEHLLLPRKLMMNAVAGLKPRGLLIVTTPYHGYFKNLALALADRFDEHWHPLRDYGHVKFFSRRTLTQLFVESGFREIHYATAGRVSMFACSMILSGKKP